MPTPTVVRRPRAARREGSLWQPGGYPEIGLAPLSLVLARDNVAELEEQLLTHEHQRGNIKFATLNLSRLHVEAGNELVSVYLGLAEKYQGVLVEYINFSANLARYGAEGSATTSASKVPALHLTPRSARSGEGDVTTLYSGERGRNVPTLLHHGITPATRSRVREHNALSPGRLSLSAQLTRARYLVEHYRLEAKWTQNLLEDGSPLEWYPVPVSYPTRIFLHEFGHLVENTLRRMGPEPYDYVLSALEDGILRDGDGKWLVRTDVLRAAGLTRDETRLRNWPRDADDPRATVWVKVLKRAVSWEMQMAYSIIDTPNWRSECFAEMFMQSVARTSPATVARLARFRAALYDVGLCVKRRRSF